MFHYFLRGRALFLKFDRDRFLRATLLQVLSFPAGGLPYFRTSVRKTVHGDGRLQPQKHWFKQ